MTYLLIIAADYFTFYFYLLIFFWTLIKFVSIIIYIGNFYI